MRKGWTDGTHFSVVVLFMPCYISIGRFKLSAKKSGMTRKDRPVVYARPRLGTKTGRVWEVADEITRESGRRASRREVVDRIAAEEGNRATANTQYQHWKSSYDATVQEPPGADEDRRNVGRQSLSVGSDGRLVIPRVMREAMLLENDPHVTAYVEAGELHVVSRMVAIRRLQREFRPLKRPGIDEVDAFLADRRAMWGEE